MDTIHGKPHNRPPVWYMRQAGRVLPSYQALKAKHSFWDMMQDPELAAEVTLLPVHDLEVDAAILFTDILVIPYAMGMGLEFTPKGPVFDKPLKDMPPGDIRLNPDASKLEYIYKAIDATIAKRPANIPLIGFCGGPLTVLCYMIEGLGTHQAFPNAVKYFYQNKEQTQKLVEAITELSVEYLNRQAAHHIDVFQLFETHAGLVPASLYNELFMPAVKRIARAARDAGLPFIFFPKGLGTGLRHIKPVHADMVSIDWQMELSEARKLVHPDIGLQGNLDPRLLFGDQQLIQQTLKGYLDFGRHNSNWIFNLGHGFMPGIPFENARYVTDWIKQANWQRSGKK